MCCDQVIDDIRDAINDDKFCYGFLACSSLPPFVERIVGNWHEGVASARLRIVDRRATVDRTKLDAGTVRSDKPRSVNGEHDLGPTAVGASIEQPAQPAARQPKEDPSIQKPEPLLGSHLPRQAFLQGRLSHWFLVSYDGFRQALARDWDALRAPSGFERKTSITVNAVKVEER
jgi:hypothetical protein